ncbi:hypothetical protein [Ereboglobus luteus]|uniref:Uncharacterized protein n=1 Tax=Ereboglobus luteus TaxID=1796921 RepID=A0A2U8E1R4_9BACT|nr:hypothetical protein [Ereboglobus luteus]AWI08803.1 hypothetical protein CKA38_05625 [Ereboglobus luteus]
MSLQRDYILRLLDQLREFLSQVVRLREAERPDDAMMAILQAQERLFGRKAALFMGLAPEEQFRALTFGEAADEARAKCLLQADLLSEMARVYVYKEQQALARGAWQYARQLLELTAEKFPGAGIDERIVAARREITLLR